MPRSQYRKKQILDDDFATQIELDALSGIPFDASNMNNKKIFEDYSIIKDNGNGLFNPSLMNNKSLYDLYLNASNIDFDTHSYPTATTASSTTFTTIYQFNTKNINTGIYRLNFQYNFRNDHPNSLYINFGYTLNQGNVVLIEKKQKQFAVNTATQFKGNFWDIVQINTSGSQNIQFGAFVDNVRRRYIVFNCFCDIFKIG